jgi:hypothetical protein
MSKRRRRGDAAGTGIRVLVATTSVGTFPRVKRPRHAQTPLPAFPGRSSSKLGRSSGFCCLLFASHLRERPRSDGEYLIFRFREKRYPSEEELQIHECSQIASRLEAREQCGAVCSRLYRFGSNPTREADPPPCIVIGDDSGVLPSPSLKCAKGGGVASAACGIFGCKGWKGHRNVLKSAAALIWQPAIAQAIKDDPAGALRSRYGKLR